jgi:hypothetical protein
MFDQCFRQGFGNRFTNVTVRAGTERSVDSRSVDLPAREDAVSMVHWQGFRHRGRGLFAIVDMDGDGVGHRDGQAVLVARVSERKFQRPFRYTPDRIARKGNGHDRKSP